MTALTHTSKLSKEKDRRVLYCNEYIIHSISDLLNCSVEFGLTRKDGRSFATLALAKDGGERLFNFQATDGTYGSKEDPNTFYRKVFSEVGDDTSFFDFVKREFKDLDRFSTKEQVEIARIKIVAGLRVMQTACENAPNFIGTFDVYSQPRNEKLPHNFSRFLFIDTSNKENKVAKKNFPEIIDNPDSYRPIDIGKQTFDFSKHKHPAAQKHMGTFCTQGLDMMQEGADIIRANATSKRPCIEQVDCKAANYAIGLRKGYISCKTEHEEAIARQSRRGA